MVTTTPTHTINPTLTIMKRQHILLATLLLLLLCSLAALRQSHNENRRLAANQHTLSAQNNALRTSVAAERLSVARLRMTVGELEELRREDAERILALGVRLRHAESMTLLETIQQLDTVVAPHKEFEQLLSDSLCRLRWQDSWVSLSAEVCRDSTHLMLTSRDTLFQVVRRVPWRWWIFSWGTKAIRQEIRSSNPHTRLVYAEYIELE